MNVVWWFALEPGEQVRMMPKGATPLYTSMRQGKPVLYALCDPKAEREQREIMVVPTGEPFVALGMLPVGVVEPSPGLFFHVFIEDEARQERGTDD